jgi:hypothetical protein
MEDGTEQHGQCGNSQDLVAYLQEVEGIKDQKRK